MKLDTLRILFVLIIADDLAGLGVPEVDAFVEACTKELTAVVGEADVPDGFSMAHIGPDASFMRHYVPNFAGAVMACAEQKVAGLWEKSDALDASFMSLPGVDPFLWDETIMLLVAQVRWRVDKTLACIIKRVAVSVVDCRRPLFKRQWLCLFLFLNFLLSFSFIPLHELLLVLCKLGLLAFELLHSLICCPGPLEISTGCVSELLPLVLELSALRFSGHRHRLLL